MDQNNNILEKPSEGRQNVFYFDPSRILDFYDENSSMYAKLYQSIPVVLLFGWMGARDKNLKKYANLYLAKGYHVIRFSPSDKLTLLQSETHPKYAYQLLDMMKNELKLVKNPIIIESFSNASCFIVYQHIIKEINQAGGSKQYDFFKQNHKAIIFDSSPGRGRKRDLIHAFADLIKPYYGNIILRYIFSMFIIFLITINHLYHFGDTYFNQMFFILISDPRPVPCLFLYSKIDIWIYYQNITKFIETKKQMFPDIHIKSVFYEDVEHVLIYPKYPEDYVKHIDEFLGKCQIDIKTVMIEADESVDVCDLTGKVAKLVRNTSSCKLLKALVFD